METNQTIPPKTTSNYLRSEIAGNVFGNHVTENMAGEESFVLCDLSNQSGSKLEYHTYKDWQGHINSGSQYPETIENTYSKTFKHVGDERGNPKSAVVFMYRIAEDKTLYWVVCWDVAGENRVYTKIKKEKIDDWNPYRRELEAGKADSESTDEVNGKKFKATVTIGGGTKPALSAKIKRI